MGEGEGNLMKHPDDRRYEDEYDDADGRHAPINRLRAHLDEEGDAEAMRQDIDQTRHAMDQTLDAIAERLNPRQWVDEVVGMLRGGSGAAGDTARDISEVGVEKVKEAGRQAARAVRQHPIPTALLIGGLAWFVAEQVSGRSASLGRSRRRSPQDMEMQSDVGREIQREKLRGESEVQSQRDVPFPPPPVPTRERNTGLPPVMPPRGSVGGRPVTVRGTPAHYPESTHLGEHQSHQSNGGHGSALKRAKATLKHMGETMTYQSNDLRDKAEEMKRQVRERAAEARHEAERRTKQAGHELQERADEMRHRASEVKQGVKSRVADVREDIRDKAEELRDRAEELRHRARERTGEVADQANYMAHEASRRVSHTARVARERSEETIQSHPLAVGAAMLGLGLLVGLAIPRSRRENRLFGEEADEFKDSARRMGENVYERGKKVAGETAEAAREAASDAVDATVETAREEAERQGLTPEQLREEGREHASDAAKRAEQDARKKA